MANIIDNRMENARLFGDLDEGDFFLYENCLYEACAIDDSYGDTYIRAVRVHDGQVIVDFCESDFVQLVAVTITIDKNL